MAWFVLGAERPAHRAAWCRLLALRLAAAVALAQVGALGPAVPDRAPDGVVRGLQAGRAISPHRELE